MSVASRSAPVHARRDALVAILVGVSFLLAAVVPNATVRGLDAGALDHLVVSEIVTGGASASDELIELHNPTAGALPLEGLEVLYVTASGATISRRATWSLGAPAVPAGGHVLIANEAGAYAPIADVLYASGMAATGGSVALRILGASTAIDAAGWGTAVTGSWTEGAPAVAPAAGASIERLPGGSSGSGQDTGDNLTDFAQRLVPEPQNLGSPPTPDPGAPVPTRTPMASATPTPAATPAPSSSASPTPSPAGAMTINAARAAPDGATVTVEGISLTASDFHDGGGFVADATGGIAVLVDGGAFERGALLRITGTVDDRFSQRTLRAGGAAVLVLGTGAAPTAQTTTTGAVIESVEGRLVRVGGSVTGSPTTLTTGLAFDVDDGSGAIRIVVGTSSGIDATGWATGTRLDLVGVAGQRDSSGSGTAGYRVMPRDPADVLATAPPGSPSPQPSDSGEPSPTPGEPGEPAGVVSIADARQAPRNTRLVVRGVVTMPSGRIDPVSAVMQDASGAILLRLGDEVGPLALGQRIEVHGTRSTLRGMETLRVTIPVEQLGTASEPAALTVRTGDAGEADEATLVVARGALVKAARRAGSGSVSFDIDDGSGPLRVVLAASLAADDAALLAGTWVEVRGVLGQETTGAEPLSGYRIWPRNAAEVRIVAGVPPASGPAGGEGSVDGPGAAAGLDEVGSLDLAELRVGATLVTGPWKELGIGGLLWDGSRLVAIDADSSGRVTAVIGTGRPPLAVELGHLGALGAERAIGAQLVSLGSAPEDVVASGAPPAAPASKLDLGDGPAWVSVVGRLVGEGVERHLRVGSQLVALEHRCDQQAAAPSGTIGVTGVALADPLRLLVPCDGIRAAPGVGRTGALAVGLPGGMPAATTSLAPAEDSAGRALAAVLLLAGGGLLLAAAATRRWLDVRQGRTEAEPALPDDESAVTPAAPQLTLVGVRREHGP